MLVHIAAASVLHRTIKDNNIYIRAQDIRRITAIPGLSPNPRASNQFTVLQNLLVGKLKNYRIFIWHDVINKSLTPHSSNNNNPCTVKELVVILKGIKHDLLRLSTVDGSLKENSCQISVNDSQKQESELLR